jgi:hypothetical protein
VPGPGAAAAGAGGRSGRTAVDDPSVAHITSLWKGGLGAGAVDWLDAHGRRTETHPLDEVAARYGRAVIGPAHTGFLTAVRDGTTAASGR